MDVSAFQGDIDWKKVARSGIDFAIIRLGYRGYGSGKLVEDEYAQKNLAGATEAGLPIGAYFFSQALSMDEADQEIEYMLGILGDYRLDMPIILDWEIPASDARTANMDARTLTDIQLYFCEKMKALAISHGLFQLAPVGEPVLPERAGGFSLLAGAVSGQNALPMEGGNVAVHLHGQSPRHQWGRGYQRVYAVKTRTFRVKCPRLCIFQQCAGSFACQLKSLG